MDSRTGFHRRFFNKRQGPIGSYLSGLFPATSTSSTTTQPTLSPTTSAITSDITTNGTPSPSSSTSQTTDTPTTLASPSSTGSTSSTSATPSTSSTPFTSSTPSDTPTPTTTFGSSSLSDVVYTSSDGTSVVYLTSTPPAPSSTTAPSPSFLEDPSLEGGVFTLVGIVALIIVFVLVTWTIRKRHRNRLERDLAAAVTFDPGATDFFERHEAPVEKHRLSGSSSGHGHGYYGMQQLPYVPQLDYHGPLGYGQYPPAGPYRAPSPNLASYQPSPPTVPQPVAQGGANLTRKFSDRKPVPPLLPDHAYHPINTHVSIPPHFYQQ